MTTSKYELDLRPALFKFEERRLSIPQFAAIIASKLDELARWARFSGEEQDAQTIQDLWERFDFISGDTSATDEEVDDALESLYDWADSPASFDAQGQPVRGEILCRVRNDAVI